jgi:hypothetical protein
MFPKMYIQFVYWFKQVTNEIDQESSLYVIHLERGREEEKGRDK